MYALKLATPAYSKYNESEFVLMVTDEKIVAFKGRTDCNKLYSSETFSMIT